MAEDYSLITLKRIAETLGLPVSAFLPGTTIEEESAASQAQMEVLELLQAFAEVTDPEQRRSCLEFIRKAASPQD